MDFCPNPDSDFVNKGNGPYGRESMSSDSMYWIPGCQQVLASMPIPPNGTTTANCDADLMWLAGCDAQTHSVNFGTNKTAVVAVNSLSPEYVCELQVPANIVKPQLELKPGTIYYWQIDVRSSAYNLEDVNAVITGDVWQFECMS